jgi:hypothetical protein
MVIAQVFVVLTMFSLLAWLFRRGPEAVDRVAVFDALAGAPAPRLARRLPGIADRSYHTFTRIGRVRLASDMAPCDEVLRGPFLMHRDPGDEDDAGGRS